jgi:deazaflavin-dependent oxidoreductase (nitroreductase family)
MAGLMSNLRSRLLYKPAARLHGAAMIRSKGRTRRPSRHGYTFLVLETVGAKTGAVRQATLLYLQHGDDFIVLASNFGQEHPPAWYFNLQAQPDAHVLHDGRRMAVRAAVVHGADRAALIPVMAAYNSQWRGYFKNVERALPVVRLTPR